MGHRFPLTSRNFPENWLLRRRGNDTILRLSINKAMGWAAANGSSPFEICRGWRRGRGRCSHWRRAPGTKIAGTGHLCRVQIESRLPWEPLHHPHRWHQTLFSRQRTEQHSGPGRQPLLSVGLATGQRDGSRPGVLAGLFQFRFAPLRHPHSRTHAVAVPSANHGTLAENACWQTICRPNPLTDRTDKS